MSEPVRLETITIRLYRHTVKALEDEAATMVPPVTRTTLIRYVLEDVAKRGLRAVTRQGKKAS